jgi:soluble lytic murein transglycosylase-like protein
LGLAALFVVCGLQISASQADETKQTARLPAEDSTLSGGLRLPAALSKDDVARYVRIFALQEDGKWRTADREIAKLDDRVLMGHVLAQRYLHPTKYRSRFKELSAWLRNYADHPDAPRIYRLALKRRPSGAARPRVPSYNPYGGISDNDDMGPDAHASPDRRSARQRREAAHHMRIIERNVRHTRLTISEKYLEKSAVRHALDTVEYDLSRSRIGTGWFFYGNAKKAYALAGPAAKRSGHALPFANWIAGLSAFRLGKYADAADHFETMVRSKSLSRWTRSAGAFWAARSNMIGRRPDRVQPMLEIAASYPRTFYGLLAMRVMGLEGEYRWEMPSIDDQAATNLLAIPAGRRAVALLQIGREGRADRELRMLAGTRDRETANAVLALADAANMPAILLRAGNAQPAKLDAALYPLPNWEPQEGFTVDRAIIFGFMRQESQFNTRAKSHAGARGLMQLMPATAGFMANKRFRGRHRNQLYDPELNISLGQKYIEHLMRNEKVNGDLLMLAAAYNGGPGNLSRWQRQARRHRYEDPLMFIESIPTRETRIFVERVLSNVWMYRLRLGQDVPSLDALAAGGPATYESLDGKADPVAQDERN